MPLMGHTLASPQISLLGGLDIGLVGLDGVPQILAEDMTFTTIRAGIRELVSVNLLGATITFTATLYEGDLDGPMEATDLDCVFTPFVPSLLNAGADLECTGTDEGVTIEAGHYAALVLTSEYTGGLVLLGAVAGQASISVG
jgi:hypothetical protein